MNDKWAFCIVSLDMRIFTKFDEDWRVFGLFD